MPSELAHGPRRFMQGVPTTFTLVVGLALCSGSHTPTHIFEGFLVVAFAALRGEKFCAGAYICRVLRGRVNFAGATCPWSKSYLRPRLLSAVANLTRRL